MKRQQLTNGKFLLSFQRSEIGLKAIDDLIKKLQTLPPEICEQSGNKYNYVISPEVLTLTYDADYGPFTRAEFIEGEIELAKFMSQFEDLMI